MFNTFLFTIFSTSFKEELNVTAKQLDFARRDDSFSLYPYSLIKYKTNLKDYPYIYSYEAISSKVLYLSFYRSKLPTYLKGICLFSFNTEEEFSKKDFCFIKIPYKYLQKLKSFPHIDKFTILEPVRDFNSSSSIADIIICFHQMKFVSLEMCEYINALEEELGVESLVTLKFPTTDYYYSSETVTRFKFFKTIEEI